MIKTNKCFWMLGLILCAAFGMLGYLIADNQPPYVYFADASYVKPSVTQKGHQVEVYWKLKVNRICPGHIIRSIVDEKTGVKFSYDPYPAISAIKIEDDHLSRTFLLPEGISPGKKIYRANAEYACNLLQRFWPLKVQTPDLYFEIVP